jgi:hypothetical protein
MESKRNIFPVRNRSDIPRLVRAYSGLGADCPFEFTGSYPEETGADVQWWMQICESPKGKLVYDLKFFTDQQMIEAVQQMQPHENKISIEFDSPDHGQYEHLHKNLWLVRSMAGVYTAARKVAHIPGTGRVRLDIPLAVTLDETKFPAIVSLEKSSAANTVKVTSLLTDTTMRFALEKMGATS